MSVPHPGEFLSVMNRRSELLRQLGDGPATKRELTDALAVSRSTVDRGIRELADEELVERTPEGYTQTLTGRLALRDYERFTRRVEGLCEGSSLLTELPPDADVDPVFLAGAEVVESERASPHRPIEELYRYVEAAERVRGFAPAIHPQQVETYRQRVAEEGMAAEVVLTDGAVERLLSEYEDALATGLAADHATIYRTDVELDYSVTVADLPDESVADLPDESVADLPDESVAGLLVYDCSGIRGCIINDAPDAVEWAERRYEAVREAATELER